MATTGVGTHYSAAIGAISTAISDNALTDSERQDVEQRLREIGADTAFLNASSPNEVAYLRRMLDTLQTLDNNQSLQQLAGLSSVDISASMMLVQLGRGNLLEEQLRIQLEDIQKRNQDIEALNGMKTELSTLRREDGQPIQMPQDLIDRLGALGISANPTLQGNELDGLISTVNARIDSLSASQQLEQIRAQSLANKRNEAFEMLSNTLSQFNKARESILSNMR
jgi:hypothetical protein